MGRTQGGTGRRGVDASAWSACGGQHQGCAGEAFLQACAPHVAMRGGQHAGGPPRVSRTRSTPGGCGEGAHVDQGGLGRDHEAHSALTLFVPRLPLPRSTSLLKSTPPSNTHWPHADQRRPSSSVWQRRRPSMRWCGNRARDCAPRGRLATKYPSRSTGAMIQVQ